MKFNIIATLLSFCVVGCVMSDSPSGKARCVALVLSGSTVNAERELQPEEKNLLEIYASVMSNYFSQEELDDLYCILNDDVVRSCRTKLMKSNDADTERIMNDRIAALARTDALQKLGEEAFLDFVHDMIDAQYPGLGSVADEFRNLNE